MMKHPMKSVSRPRTWSPRSTSWIMARYDLRDRLLAALERGAPLTDLAREAGQSVHQAKAIIRLPD